MILKTAYILSFLDIFSLGVLVPLIHKHFLTSGGTHLAHGILGTIVALITFISGPIIGGLSDAKGRRHVLRMIFLIALVSNSALLFASYLPFFVLSRLLSGISSKSQILIKTLISDHVAKEKQAGTYGKLSAVSAFGFIIGPIAGGYLYQKTENFNIISTLLSAISLICIGILSFVPNKTTTMNSSEKRNVKKEILESFTKMGNVNWKNLWDIFTLKLLSELAYSQFYATFGILPDIFQLNHIHIGYIMSIYGIMFIITSLVLARVNTILPNEPSKKISITFIVLTVTLFCLYMASNVYTFVLFLLPLALTKSIFDATFLAALSERVTESERGITMGSYDSTMSLAGLTTPLFMGILNQYYGYNISRLIALIPATLATLLSYVLIERKLQKVNID